MTGRNGYQKAREHLRRDFAYRCAYCMIHEHAAGGAESFWIDHFKPRSKGGRVNDYANLYWAYMLCNHIKSNNWPTRSERRRGQRFADPCQEQDYGVHFVEDEEGKLVPQTPCGEYHVRMLRLNRTLLVARRRERNAFVARRSEAIALVERLERQAATLSGDEAAIYREVIAHVQREIESLEAELKITIPFIPLQSDCLRDWVSKER
ncbi:MAG: HNH endonuclease [Abditibacteriales bacterium]|nr:HNH endonuclease [Abditibacteriales bacterium]